MPAKSISAYERMKEPQQAASLPKEEFLAAIRTPMLNFLLDCMKEDLGWWATEGARRHVHVADFMSPEDIRLVEKRASADLLMELTDIASMCLVGRHLWYLTFAVYPHFDAVARHYMEMGVKLSEEQTVRLIEHYRWRRECRWGLSLHDAQRQRELPDRVRAIEAFIKVVSPWVAPSPLRFWRRPGKAREAFMRLFEDPHASKFDLMEVNRLRAVVGLPEVEPLVEKVYTPESAVEEVRDQIREIRAFCLAQIARLAEERPEETFYAMAITATWLKADSLEGIVRVMYQQVETARTEERAALYRARAAQCLAAGTAYVDEEPNPGDWELELADLGEAFPGIEVLNSTYYNDRTRVPAGRFYVRIMNDLVKFIAASDEVKRLKRTDGFQVFWSKDLD